MKRHALVLVLMILNGCGALMLVPTMPKEKRLEDLYYTHIGTDPFPENAKDGIIVGKVTLSGLGSVLSIYQEGQSAPVSHTLQFNKKKQYGLIFWKKEQTRQTVDVFAGNLPKERKEAYKDIYSPGAVLRALFLGSGGTWRLNFAALHTQLPSGWFMLRLPPGRYQIRDVGYENYETDIQKNFDGSTITTVTKTTLSVADGPSFEVAPGVINYIGEFDYTEKGVTIEQDLARAETIVRTGLRRMPVKEPAWKIMLAPNITPSPATQPAP